MVNGLRYGFLGYQEVDPLASLAVLSGLTLAVVLLDIYLFKRGYGLVGLTCPVFRSVESVEAGSVWSDSW